MRLNKMLANLGDGAALARDVGTGGGNLRTLT